MYGIYCAVWSPRIFTQPCVIMNAEGNVSHQDKVTETSSLLDDAIGKVINTTLYYFHSIGISIYRKIIILNLINSREKSRVLGRKIDQRYIRVKYTLNILWHTCLIMKI